MEIKAGIGVVVFGSRREVQGGMGQPANAASAFHAGGPNGTGCGLLGPSARSVGPSKAKETNKIYIY
jgi:hypothetical protein